MKLETKNVEETSEKTNSVLDKIYLQLFEQKQELKRIIHLLTSNQCVTDAIRSEVIDRLNDLLNQQILSITTEENHENMVNKDNVEPLVEVKVEELITNCENEKVIKSENEFEIKNFICNDTKITKISSDKEKNKANVRKRKPKDDILKVSKKVKNENGSTSVEIKNDDEVNDRNVYLRFA